MDPVSTAYFVLDLAVGLAAPVILTLLYRQRRLAPPLLRLFWIAVALGLTWEVPIFLAGFHATTPLVAWIHPPPVPPLLLMVAHALWDGALMLAGLAVVRLICRPPSFCAFRLAELAVLVAFGQVSAVAVELSAVTAGAWEYVGGHPWNPTLVTVGGHALTLLPQAIWLLAPVVFYPLALRARAGAVSSTP